MCVRIIILLLLSYYIILYNIIWTHCNKEVNIYTFFLHAHGMPSKCRRRVITMLLLPSEKSE